MKSGDIKLVARQVFLLTKSNLLTLWDNSKKEYLQEPALIEKNIKNQLDYDNKMNELLPQLNTYKNILAAKTQPTQPQVLKLAEALKNRFLENRSEFNFGEGEREGFFTRSSNTIIVGKTSYDTLSNLINEGEGLYKYVIETYNKDKDFELLRPLAKEQYDKFLKVKALYNTIQDDTKGERENIYSINNKVSEINKEIQSKTQAMLMANKQRSIDSFQISLKKDLISSFETNLNGESSLSIKKGHYYLFGIGQVAQNNIIWNLPINIDKKEQYIELSNDNAFSTQVNDLYSELAEALPVISTMK